MQQIVPKSSTPPPKKKRMLQTNHHPSAAHSQSRSLARPRSKASGVNVVEKEIEQAISRKQETRTKKREELKRKLPPQRPSNIHIAAPALLTPNIPTTPAIIAMLNLTTTAAAAIVTCLAQNSV